MNLLLIGYELSTTVLPAFFTTAILKMVCKEKGLETKRHHSLPFVLFVLYIFATLHVTGTGTVFDVKRYGLRINPEHINLIPFSDPNLNVVAYVLNVILFLPLGFLVPLVWPTRKNCVCAITAGFFLSLLIELSQLLNNRRTDIDDLILNTAGAIIGVVLFCFLRRMVNRDGGADRFLGGPFIYLAIMFLCRFLLFDEFGAAKLLFGF